MTPSPAGSAVGVDRDAPMFTAFDRGERGIGVRDRVLVLPSVICSRVVADRVADAVPEAVSAPHDHGCGQIGDDEAQTRRAFVGVGSNPNVAGTVVVGLGCETVQSDEVASALDATGVPVREVAIQDAGGTAACVDRGVAAAESLRDGTAGPGGDGAGAGESHTGGPGRETPADLSDLTVGVVSGDLAGSTREVADPLVGDLVDAVVDAGGRVVVAGSERLLANPDAARDAAADAATAAAVDDLVERYAGQPARASRVGHEARELSFEETTRFWGDQPVETVLDYGEVATRDEGLAVVDAPSRFEEAATGLAAAGAHLVVHVTGEGVPTGHPVVPVCKVSADPETLAAVGSDVDLDATDATGDDLLEAIRATAAGEPTRAESHGLTAMAITRVGPSM